MTWSFLRELLRRRRFDQWVTLELMGHRLRRGRLTEVRLAGCGFFRLESADGFVEFYRPGAIYCITPTPEARVRAIESPAVYDDQEIPF